MTARRTSTTARRKATIHRGEEPNGNGRVTVAVLGTKMDNLAEDVKEMRAEHDEHVSTGSKVLERIAALEGKWTVLMWGIPISVTIVGIATSLIFALR
jgi:uncharacterized membrane protein